MSPSTFVLYQSTTRRGHLPTDSSSLLHNLQPTFLIHIFSPSFSSYCLLPTLNCCYDLSSATSFLSLTNSPATSFIIISSPSHFIFSVLIFPTSRFSATAFNIHSSLSITYKNKPSFLASPNQ